MNNKPLLLLLLLCSLNTFAQQIGNKGKIRLKDGTILKAVIKENIPGEYIKIDIPWNGEATINYSEIASIRHNYFSYHPKYTRPKGFFWEGSFSLAFGQSSKDGGPRAGIELGATFNYRFNQFVCAGVGVEPMAFMINTESIFIPVYARFKGTTADQRVTPYYSFDIGWAFAEKTSSSEAIDTQGGWFVRPTIGVQVGHFSLGLGYQLQKLTTTTETPTWWWNSNKINVEERLMKNVVFSTSFSF